MNSHEFTRADNCYIQRKKVNCTYFMKNITSHIWQKIIHRGIIPSSAFHWLVLETALDACCRHYTPPQYPLTGLRSVKLCNRCASDCEWQLENVGDICQSSESTLHYIFPRIRCSCRTPTFTINIDCPMNHLTRPGLTYDTHPTPLTLNFTSSWATVVRTYF